MINLSCLKFHYSKPTFSDPGWENPDYRGEREIGSSDGDHHGTAFEIDPIDVSGADEALAQFLEDIDVELPEGATLKGVGEIMLLKILEEFNKKSVRQVATGVYLGIRGGLWPGDGRV